MTISCIDESYVLTTLIRSVGTVFIGSYSLRAKRNGEKADLAETNGVCDVWRYVLDEYISRLRLQTDGSMTLPFPLWGLKPPLN